MELRRLRSFLAAITEKLQSMPDPEGHAQSWLKWTGVQIDQLDPLSDASGIMIRDLVEGHGLSRWAHTTTEEDELWGY